MPLALPTIPPPDALPGNAAEPLKPRAPPSVALRQFARAHEQRHRAHAR